MFFKGANRALDQLDRKINFVITDHRKSILCHDYREKGLAKDDLGSSGANSRLTDCLERGWLPTARHPCRHHLPGKAAGPDQ